MNKVDYKQEIGKLIAETRIGQGLTQAELAKALGTSQSAINRIEKGGQNISLDMVAKVSEVLNRHILSINRRKTLNFKINGGRKLHGSIKVNTSKNAAVALLCASILNKGKTTLKYLAKIEEVYRIIEVLNSLGVKTTWVNNGHDLEIVPPKKLTIDKLNKTAAQQTRSVIMLMGPLLHFFSEFKLPYAGGCHLGQRTITPHLNALEYFGLSVSADITGFYDCVVSSTTGDKIFTLGERGDTVTENAILAAALDANKTTIRNASPNYMVQDLCFFLQDLGVKIDGVGTTTLVIRGKTNIDQSIEYYPAEDPIEAMSFVAAAVVTDSEITVKRVPMEFLEVELETLRQMQLQFEVSSEYQANNGRTRLADITVKSSNLVAPADKIHPLPAPGLNIDNLPFFAIIAACATGRTLIHDWVFENRAVYLTELNKLGANTELLDAHRIYIEGPTHWHAAEMITPPALRPAVVIMLGMLAAKGESILRNVYSINRGYEDFAKRLNSLGADIETLTII
ncbi:UDP-N-acetylglucosamine 1-carboxyvinyltransferase [Candidatus Saccharibacteria bacterium]|nr:UDP-N-acetylglucosamine 1-carboxyvinyltransferase [Candidatus Saccharibacteria bacterium]